MIRSRNRFCYLMVAPTLILVVALGIYPMLDTLRLSFLEYNLLRIAKHGTPFVGFKNFDTIFHNPMFMQTLFNTLAFSVLIVIGVTVLGLLIAMFMNLEIIGRNFLRSLFLVPWVTPPVVGAAIWLQLCSTTMSPINHLLKLLGIIDGNVRFLTDVRTLGPLSIPFLVIAAVRIWHGLPFTSVMLLAGLQSISDDLYEAAEIDGASTLGKFRFVTLPMLRDVLLVTMTLLFISTIGHFATVYVMTAGGPNNLTNILGVYAYTQAFVFYHFDIGAATSSIILVLTGTVAAIYVYLQSRMAAIEAG